MSNAQHYPRFSDAEFARRHEATRALMERNGCDTLILFGSSAQGGTGQADIYYLSHHMGRQENILVFMADRDPVLLVTAFNHVPNAQRQSVIADTRYGGPKTRFARTLAELLRDRGAATDRIGIVGWMPYQVYNPLFEAFPEAEAHDLTAQFRMLRLHKSAEELEWLRRGAERTDAAMMSMVEGMRAGMKEFELGALLGDGYRAIGGEDYLHYISSTPQDDPERCVPAQTASQRTLEAGDVVAVELSIGYYGYAGQALRTMILDAEPNSLYSDLYEVAETAYYRMCEAIKPGSTTEDVLAAAEVIDERGYAIVDGLLHGYGIGLLPPSVPGEGYPTTLTRPVRMGTEKQKPFVFEKDMTLVVQPNVTTED
ncbi:MAG: M24 family metallopeptidase, partial [Actinomycetota bacterium]